MQICIQINQLDFANISLSLSPRCASMFFEVALSAGFDGVMDIANDMLIGESIERIIPKPVGQLEAPGIKRMLIMLKYKHQMTDAQLGFFRSSIHRDSGFFADVKDYLAIEKDWFNPYLFASGRILIIPWLVKSDVMFCHGPCMAGKELHILK